MDLKFGKEMSQNFIFEKLNQKSDSSIHIAKKLAKLANIRQKNCVICHGTKSKKVFAVYNLEYLRCLKCSHVYVEKRLSEKLLNRYYSEDENYSTSTYANTKLVKIRRDLFKSKIQFVKKYAYGKEWLDVGSADGTAVIVARKAGFNCDGIEISKPSLEFAKKYHNLNLIPKPLELFANETQKKFDVISFFGVLEHLPNPIDTLKICNKLLKKNGIIVILVPHFDSISTYIQFLHGRIDRHLVPHSHIMMFSIKSAKHAFKRTGFNPIALWCFGMDSIELLKYMKNKDKKFEKSELYQILQKNLNLIQQIFDKNALGDEFIMIGRKMQ